MALNKYMHPRNIYKNRKPDFKSLAAKYDYFREKVTINDSGKVILDFKDPAALRALTQALLQDDFGLVVTLPLDRLIPTVPQRLNYILWLEDIIGRENGAKGIDIGSGASCIYPLLGCRLNKWQFIASEIDDQNIYFANKNIAANKMEDNIAVKKVTDEVLLLGVIDDNETYDFCMCNPPFYSDHLEAQGITTSRTDNRSESSSVSTASEAESIAWGGEVRFVSQMIEESLVLKTKVRVYTSLLGKKQSLSQLKDILRQKQVPKFSSTEFCQGRTMRWGIAWTFDDTVEFPKSTFKEKKKEKPPLTYEVPRSSESVVGDYTVQAYTWFVIKQLEELQIHFYTKHSGKFYACFILQAKENTWSHQRRKRRKQQRLEHDKDSTGDSVKSMEKENGGCATDEKSTPEKTEQVGKEGNSGTGTRSNVAKGDVEVDKARVDDKVVFDESNNAIGGGAAKEMEVSESNGVKRPLEDSWVESEPKRLKTSDSEVEHHNGVTGEAKENVADGDTSGDSFKDKVEAASTDKVDIGGSSHDEAIDMNTDKDRDESEIKTSGDKEDGAESDKTADDVNNKLVRKEVVERFWKEQEENDEQNRKKKERSFVEVLEPFKEDEECLMLSKMVLRKDEGVITFSLTHLAGQREAMHQIMQYFKNKWPVQEGS